MVDFPLNDALAAGAQRAPTHETPDGGMAIVVPPNYRVEKLPPLDAPLTRIRQQVLMHDRDSFVEYVNRFKTPATQIFAESGFIASGGKASISAALDYHEPAKADYLAHNAIYQPRYSEQWARWMAACGQAMKQAEFAEFIEEVRNDIVEPSAAQLYDIVRAFKASKKVEFDSVSYQANGDVRLVYDERTEQKGQSGILPEKMTIGLPVYFRGTPYQIEVFVRYKVGNGGVMFALKIDRADVIEDEAFSELTSAISSATGIKPYLGRR